MEGNPITIVQFTTVLLAFLICYEVVKIHKLDKENWLRTLNILIWTGHLLGFYLMFALNSLGILDWTVNDPDIFTRWSSYLRMHSALTFYLTLKSTRTFMILSKKTASIIAKYTMKSEDENES